jgi:DNA-binding transcriptional LysR family regulator
VLALEHGTFVLPRILAAFRALHPGITLELSLSNQNEDLLRRDADIAVRMGRPEQGALVARRVGGIPIGLYASRSYLAARGVPATASDLAGHDFVGRDRARGLGGGLRVGDYVVSSQQFVFRCDSDVAQLAAVRAGVGIGVCQHGVARGDPDLVPVLPDVVRHTLDTWVVMHEDLRGSLRVRLLFEHLVEQLLGYAREGEPARVRLA